MIELQLLSKKIFLVKVTLKIGQDKYLLLIMFWKLIFWTNKLKDFNGEKIIVNFYEKELLLSVS